MGVFHKAAIIAAAFIAVAVFALPAHSAEAPASRSVLIVDSSNSMWSQIKGRGRFAIAREVLSSSFTTYDGRFDLGIVAYGHRVKDSCTDIQTIMPIGKIRAEEYSRAIRRLKPRGMTPISRALNAAMKVTDSGSPPDNVILLSDGIDNCGPDPCSTAAALKSLHQGLKIHVMALNVPPDKQARLRCIAENTEGEFVTAQDEPGLAAAADRIFDLIAAQDETVQDETVLAEQQSVAAQPPGSDGESGRETPGTKTETGSATASSLSTAPDSDIPVPVANPRATAGSGDAAAPEIMAMPDIAATPEKVVSPRIVTAAEILPTPKVGTTPDDIEALVDTEAVENTEALEVAAALEVATASQLAMGSEFSTSLEVTAVPDVAATPRVMTTPNLPAATGDTAVRGSSPPPGTGTPTAPDAAPKTEPNATPNTTSNTALDAKTGTDLTVTSRAATSKAATLTPAKTPQTRSTTEPESANAPQAADGTEPVKPAVVAANTAAGPATTGAIALDDATKVKPPAKINLGNRPIPKLPDEVRPTFLINEEPTDAGDEGVRLRGQITSATATITRPIDWTAYKVEEANADRWRKIASVETAEASISLPPGRYVVRASYGAARAAKVLEVKPGKRIDATFILNAGGLRVLPGLAFLDTPKDIFAKHWVFGAAETKNGKRRLFAQSTAIGEVIRLNAGTYTLISRFGNANAVVETNITIRPGTLTEVEINHKVGIVTFRLNTPAKDASGDNAVKWQLVDAGGTIIVRAGGPEMKQILAPGNYRIMAEYRDKSYTSEFTVEIGETKAVEIAAK